MPCRCITIIANMDVNLHEPLQKKKSCSGRCNIGVKQCASSC